MNIVRKWLVHITNIKRSSPPLAPAECKAASLFFLLFLAVPLRHFFGKNTVDGKRSRILTFYLVHNF